MGFGSTDMSMEDLVDILAQKTQVFTQLLLEKKFDKDYLDRKREIQEILAEIELRKHSELSDQPNVLEP